MNTRITRSVSWDGPIAKARWLDAMCTLDARLPAVRDFARRVAMSPLHDPNDQEALARDLHQFVRDCIKYIRDPAGEEFSDAQQVFQQGFGDCDDKVRLFVALCRSLGIEARVLPIFRGSDFVHVQAEVRVGNPPRWMVAELIVKGIALGEHPRRKAPLT